MARAGQLRNRAVGAIFASDTAGQHPLPSGMKFRGFLQQSPRMQQSAPRQSGFTCSGFRCKLTRPIGTAAVLQQADDIGEPNTAKFENCGCRIEQ